MNEKTTQIGEPRILNNLNININYCYGWTSTGEPKNATGEYGIYHSVQIYRQTTVKREIWDRRMDRVFLAHGKELNKKPLISDFYIR